MYGRAIALVFFLWTARPLLYSQDADCSLPFSVQQVVDRQWKGWRVLQFADLGVDDQSLWLKKNGHVCPGFAPGHFVRQSGDDCAFVLIQEATNQQVVIVALAQQKTYRLETISAPSPVLPSVIQTFPPGDYSDVETGRKVKLRYDSIAVEQIEATLILYFWNKGKFQRIWLVD